MTCPCLIRGPFLIAEQVRMLADKAERLVLVVGREFDSDLVKSGASYRTVPIFPAVEQELAALLERRLTELRDASDGDADPRELDDELVFHTRTGHPLSPRNVAQRGVQAAASSAGLGHVTPKLLRSSFCSLAGRRHVDPVEAAQLTGHSLAVWTQNYARSFGKAQRDEARARMLEHGFGAVDEPELNAEELELDAEA